MSGDNRNYGTRVFVGNCKDGTSKEEVEAAFGRYGPLENVWVARSPSGFAFVTFQDGRDAADACRADWTKQGWRVEVSHGKSGGGRGGGGRGGAPGGEGGGRGFGRNDERGGDRARERSPRRRSRSPAARRSRSPARRRSPSPARRHARSRSPPRRRAD